MKIRILETLIACLNEQKEYPISVPLERARFDVN